MTDDAVKLMPLLEGDRLEAYDCPLGYRTIGKGFNMEDVNAQKVWSKLNIKEDFDQVYYKQIKISQETSDKLFLHLWNGWCEKTVKSRCEELEVHYDSLSPTKQFILKDIAYNTGSVKHWYKVFKYRDLKKVLFEARRKPKELLDSRVYKIGLYFGIINDENEARELGIEFV